MTKLESGINLIGMMNSGKTTVGRIIAARYDLPFVDTDNLIHEVYGQAPGDIIKTEGAERFMIVQNEIIRARSRSGPEVWATGGAAAKDSPLMKHLGAFGVGVFLFVEPDILEARTPPEDIAKLANPNNLSFRDLYLNERMSFYLAAADVTVRVDNPLETPEVTADRVVAGVISRSISPK